MKRYGGLVAGAAIAFVLLLSAAIAVPAIGDHTPFFTRGEPREAIVVQTIARGDGLVLPLRNGDELPSKPPLFHWLGALSSLAHGRVSEGSIRFPGLAASIVTSAATAAAAWAWWGPTTAMLTTVVLATSFQWLASSVSARVDMILAACITLALLLFARAIETGRRIPVLAYALMTAATLTKGPVGFVLPVTIALVTLAVRGELRFLGWRDLRLLVVAVAVAGLWYVAAFAIGGQAFIDKQILKENVFRVLDADAVEAGHVEPFWFYVPLLAAGLAPWSLFVPGLAACALARSRYPKNPAAASAAVHQGDALEPFGPPVAEAGLARPSRFDAHTMFALVWGTTTFVLFSLAGSKRAVYLLPAFPAYAMLIAVAWTRIVREGAVSVAALVLLAGAALVAAVLGLVGVTVLLGSAGVPLAGWLAPLMSDADVNNVAPMLEAMTEHRLVVLPCAAVILGAAYLAIAAAARGRWRGVVAATAVAMFALSTTVSTSLLPALAVKRSTRGFLMRVQEKVPMEVPLSFYRAFDYGAVFYRGAAIPVRQGLRDVPEIDGAWLLTWPAFLPALAEEVRKTGTGGEAAGAYEVEEVIASEDVDPSDRTSLVLVRIVRRIGDEHSGGN